MDKKKSLLLTHDPDVENVRGVLPLQIVGRAGVIPGMDPVDALKYQVFSLRQDSNPGLWGCLNSDSLQQIKQFGVDFINCLATCADLLHLALNF